MSLTLEQILAEKIRQAKNPTKEPTTTPIQDSSIQEPEVNLDDLVTLVSAKEITQDEPINYRANNIPVPDSNLFSALHIPFIRNPYDFDVSTYRSYKRWLLSGSAYVGGLFTSSTFDNLRVCIMHYYHPRRTIDLHKLFMMLSEFEMSVPAEYEQVFINFIEGENHDRASNT